MISFLTYSSFILSSWAESYPGNEIQPNIHGFNQMKQYKILTPGDFYVFKVTFTTLNEISSDGGAIYANAATRLLVESSSFISCHSKGKGGAIYFKNADGRCFLKKVCSTNSYSSGSQFHFCLIFTKKSDQCTLNMEHSSVSSLKFPTNFDNNVDLQNSDVIIMKYDNISKNECKDDAALGFSPSVSGSVSYTSFENNTSADYDVICFNKNVNVNTCNVIGNVDKNTNLGIIMVVGSLTISNSCLVENNCKTFIFDSSGTSSCRIINCTIDNTAQHGKGNVVVENRPAKSFINDLGYNGCFSKSMLPNDFVCPSVNIRQYKCQMNKYRGIFALTKF